MFRCDRFTSAAVPLSNDYYTMFREKIQDFYRIFSLFLRYNFVIFVDFNTKYVENNCYLGRNRNNYDKKIRCTAEMPCSGEKWIAFIIVFSLVRYMGDSDSLPY